MAQRWAAQKLATDKARRDRKLGRHGWWHDKAEYAPTRAVEMPSPSIDTSAMVEHFLVTGKVTRGACKGIMPQDSMGRVMRKARHAPVKLWTGHDGSKGRVAAPGGKGLLASNWDRSVEWRIVRKV